MEVKYEVTSATYNESTGKVKSLEFTASIEGASVSRNVRVKEDQDYSSLTAEKSAELLASNLPDKRKARIEGNLAKKAEQAEKRAERKARKSSSGIAKGLPY